MPVRRWLSHPPIGVGLAVAILLLIAGLQNHYGNAGSRQYAATVEHQQPQILAQSCDAECKAERAEQRAEEDLEAQKQMAQWALWLFGVSLVGVCLLGATLYETRNAGRSAADILVQTKRQADIADDTAKLELRARLSVLPAGINQLIATDEGMGHVALRNVGKLPARNVSLYVFMRVSNWRDTEFIVPDDTEAISRVIQPGTEMRQGSNQRIPTEKLQRADDYVFVWGIAYYDDGYGQRRFTRFCHRYNGASHNRIAHWATSAQPPQSRSIIDPDKARYHTHGNDAD